MDQTKQCMIVLFFLLGCSAVLSENAEKAACTDADVEECSKDMATFNETKKEDLCNGILDKTHDCFKALKEKCTLSEAQKGVMDKAVKEIEESKEGCEKEKEEPAKTTCDDAKVDECHKSLEVAQEPSNPSISQCTLLDSVMKCTMDAVKNCLNATVKASLMEVHQAVKKNMSDMKCCDQAALKKCPEVSYAITNETATQEICKTASESKDCVDPLLAACDDKLIKKPFEEAVKEVKMGLEICESKGFMGGNGATIQPALLLVFATACLATISKFV